MNISLIIRDMIRLRNYERIPKLPRGMLASHYEALTEDEARVVARMGARDPASVRIAMKRADAANVDELVGQLEHYRARRHIGARANKMLDRFFHSTPYHPHREEIIREVNSRPRNREIKDRLRRARL